MKNSPGSLSVNSMKSLLGEQANRMPVGIFETDLNGIVTFINQIVLQWMGYEEVGLPPLPSIELFVFDFERSEMKNRFAEVIEQDKHLTRDYSLLCKDGTLFPVLISSFAIKDSRSRVIGLRGVIVDNTSQFNAKRRVRRNEKALENLIANLPGFVYRCLNDKNWTMKYLSDGFSAITGYSGQEVMVEKKITFNDIIDPDFREYLWLKWQEKLASKSLFEEEYRIITKSGKSRWVWERGRGIFNEEGELFVIEGFITDITDRKRTELIQKMWYNISNAAMTTITVTELIEVVRVEMGKLIDTSNFYAAFYNEHTGMFHTIHEVDEHDHFRSWPAEKSLTGYIMREKKVLLIKHAEYEILREHGEVGQVGSQAAVWLGVPMFEKDKVIGVLAIQDYNDPDAFDQADVALMEFVSRQISLYITNKKGDEELKQALANAEESDRLKSAFLATMNHELRTPLNHIIGFSELILAGVMPEDNKSFATSIYNSGKNLLSIIEDVFDLALAEQADVKMRLQTFRLMDLFMENKSSFDHILYNAGKSDRIALIFKPDTRLLSTYVTVDRGKVNKILINLFKNSVKFTNQGSIEFGYQMAQPGRLTFFIKDTGIGIPKEKQSVIFDYFRQGDDSPTRNFGGVGIGLSISSRIAKILSGELSLVSEPNEGTTVFLSVPVEFGSVRANDHK